MNFALTESPWQSMLLASGVDVSGDNNASGQRLTDIGAEKCTHQRGLDRPHTETRAALCLKQ